MYIHEMLSKTELLLPEYKQPERVQKYNSKITVILSYRSVFVI